MSIDVMFALLISVVEEAFKRSPERPRNHPALTIREHLIAEFESWVCPAGPFRQIRFVPENSDDESPLIVSCLPLPPLTDVPRRFSGHLKL